MENNATKSFSFNFKQILIDEIALNGLEGIGTEQLWKHVEKRISAPVTAKSKTRFWSFLVNCEELTFYELPEPVEPRELLDRFMIIDEETGTLVDPPEYLDGPYEYNPIEEEYGSCVHYDTRKRIPNETLRLPYEDVFSQYGHKLVIVASLETRWQALAPHMPITTLKDLMSIQYCLLELIGKGRENGQVTLGNTNLLKVSKDSKWLFYNRNTLSKMGLICAQPISQLIGHKMVKALMFRLKRFYEPALQIGPKMGIQRNLMEHLRQQPDYCDRTEAVYKKGIVKNGKLFKRLRKSSSMFKFIEKPGLPGEGSSRHPNRAPKKQKCIMLAPISDESSDSDQEIDEPRKCQYKVGVNIFRQAYERFIEAGLNGLTQMELGQILGLEFYMSRTICRIFKMRNIVREFLEDRGRQRTAKYIAVQATRDMDVKYEEEKKQFFKYLDESKNFDDTFDETAANIESVDSDSEVPRKKIKLTENDEQNIVDEICEDDPDSSILAKHIIEVKTLDGLESHNTTSLFGSKKNPTMRQLRFANGLVKVIREKLVVPGYQRASFLASREVGEPPMDSKGLKIILQKLINEGQIKVYRIKYKDVNPYTRLFCAPHVKPTDPVMKSRFREIKIKSIAKAAPHVPSKKMSDNSTKFLSLYMYPRYMRIQKIHEYLYKLVYSGDGELNQFGFQKGFSSMVHIMPEMTVAFAICNLSPLTLSKMNDLRVSPDMMEKKLKDLPQEVLAMFLSSKSFQQCFRMNMKILAMLGLVQLVQNPTQVDTKLFNNMFYINRKAKILDTTGDWPRCDGNVLTKSYTFDTLDDIERYWSDVQFISIKTKVLTDLNERKRKQLQPPLRLREEVLENDNGQRFGDGRGPCGFDSTFYLEQRRYWASYYSKIKKKTLPSQLKALAVPKKEKQKATKIKAVRKRKVVSKPTIKPTYKRRPRGLAKWTEEEDKLLMICKAAVTIFSPVSQPGCLRLRNLIAKEILMVKDPKKTGTICHKRYVMLEPNTTLSYEKDCILNELRRRRHLIQKYEGLYKSLKHRFIRNMTKFLSEARIPMLELVYLILKLIKSKSFNQKVPCVAVNLEDFHAKFAISATSTNKPYNLYHTPREEPVMAALKEGILMTVMMSYKSESTVDLAQRLLSMFSKFPEPTLRLAIDQLRKCGAVSAKEKILNNQLNRHQMKDILQESFKVSACYMRKWICRLNADFVDKLMDCVYLPTAEKDIKGCPEINCLLCELQSCNIVDIVSESLPVVMCNETALPEDLNTETNLKLNLNSGSCSWIKKINVKTFSELYEDMAVRDSLDELSRNAEVQISDVESCNIEDEITSFLRTKKELGSTFPELQEHTRLDEKTLTQKLQFLEAEQVIKRIGYFENIIVLTEYAKYWTINLDGAEIIPVPYLTLNSLKVRNDVLLKWAGVILNKVFENPGCHLYYLTDSCDLLSGRATQEICMFLEKCKCVVLRVLKTTKPNLFSEDSEIPELKEFNFYESLENIVVFPVRDSFTRFAALKQKIIDLSCHGVSFAI